MKTRFFATLMISSGLQNPALLKRASADLYRWTDANDQVQSEVIEKVRDQEK